MRKAVAKRISVGEWLEGSDELPAARDDGCGCITLSQ
jgi:hypothetical protein